MNTKAELLRRIRKDRDALSRIEEREWLKENHKHIGKWFKYRNCYSCPEAPADYWWCYKKIIGITDKHFRTWEFQTDKYGNDSIKSEDFGHLSGWIECHPQEARSAWASLMDKLKLIKP